jgi:hypothetical protein
MLCDESLLDSLQVSLAMLPFSAGLLPSPERIGERRRQVNFVARANECNGDLSPTTFASWF